MGNPQKIKFNFAICFDSEKQARKVEKILHNKLNKSRLIGEWFEGHTNLKRVISLFPKHILEMRNQGKKAIIFINDALST